MVTSITAHGSAHVVLQAQDKLRITNPSGHQVVDCWAFPLSENSPAWMSMAQTRSKLLKLIPEVDDTLIDTRREALLTLLEDSSAGVHDMLFPPCDKWRYEQAGAAGHESCGGNLRTELVAFIATLGEGAVRRGRDSIVELESSIRRWGWTPEPLNLFMNVAWAQCGRGELSVKPPQCQPGDFVVLQAEVDCLVVMSACPNDLMDMNAGAPGSAEYEVVA